MSAQLKILLFAISILFTPILLLATGLSFDFDEGYLALLFFYYSPIPASLIGILISIVVLSFDKNQNTLVFFRNVCLPQKAFSIRSQVGTAGAFVLILLLWSLPALGLALFKGDLALMIVMISFLGLSLIFTSILWVMRLKLQQILAIFFGCWLLVELLFIIGLLFYRFYWMFLETITFTEVLGILGIMLPIIAGWIYFISKNKWKERE